MSQQQQYGLTFRAVSERAYTRRHHLPGSAASPTFAFDDARGTGFFLANVDTGMMGVAVNGEQKMLLDSNTITFDGDIEITGNLVTGEGNVALDFGNIGQSLVPAEDVTYDLGAPGRAWRQLYVDEIQVANLLDESGNAYNNLDLTAVETDILPVDASTLDIGSATKPWRTVVADNVDASNVSVSNDISVDGSATITGDVSLGSNVSIGNDISVGGSIDVGGLVIDANFQQDLITIIETGNVDLDLSNVGSDILPSDDATYAIGSAGKTWTELHVGEVAAATATIAGLATAASGNVLGDLAVGGDTSITGDVSAATATIGTSVEIAGETVATDGQGFTFTNDLLPVANMSSSLGTVQKWWERVYAQEVQTNQLTAENISVTGNLLVELGELIANSNVQLDLSNTSTDIIAVSNVYDLGSEGAPWGKLWVEEAHVSKFTDTNELRVGTDGVSTDLVPSTGALALGSVPSPWSAIYADELTAGDVAVNNNLAVSGNAVFDQDISVGGTIDVGGLVIDANFQQDLITIIETGNVDLDLSNVGSDILPSDDATYAIGSAGKTWTELHVGEVFASNVRVSNDISVDGSATINGDVSLGSNVSIGNDISVDGSIDVGGLVIDANFQQDLITIIETGNVDLDLSNVGSDILPSDDATYAIGSVGTTWTELHVGEVFADNVDASGNVTVGGDIVLSGQLLDASGNAVQLDLTAVESDVIPADADTYVMGTNVKPWLEGHFSTLDAGELNASNVSVRNDISVDGSATINGDVSLGSNVSIGNDISVGGSIDVGGLVIDANFQQDLITIIETGNVDLDLSNVGSDILPSDDATYAIGSAGTTWTELHVGEVFARNVSATDLSVSGNAIFDNAIDVGGLIIDNTFESNLINTIVSGNATIDLSHVESDVTPANSMQYSLGAADKIWTALHAANVNADDVTVTNDLSVSGNAAFGEITINGTAFDDLVVNIITDNGDAVDLTNVQTDVVPTTGSSLDIGTGLLHWSNAYVDHIYGESILTTGDAVIMGNLQAQGSATIDGDLTVSGTLHGADMVLSGNATFDQSVSINNGMEVNGNLVIDGTAFDDLVVNIITDNGDAVDLTNVQTDVVPTTGSSLDIGTGLLHWSNAYVDHIYGESILMTGDAVIMGNLQAQADFEAQGDIILHGQLLSPSGNAVQLDLEAIESNVTPADADTYSLGSASRHWQSLYVNDVVLAGSIVDPSGNSVGLDLTAVTSDVIGAEPVYTLGSEAVPWQGTHTTSVNLSADEVLATDANGITISSSLVPTANVACSLGMPDLMWDRVYANDITALNIHSDSLTIGANLLADLEALIDQGKVDLDLSNLNSSVVATDDIYDVGEAGRPWGDVYANRLHGNIDASYIDGVLSGNIELENATFNGTLSLPSGTRNNPSIGFEAEDATGLYFDVDDGALGFVTNGLLRFEIGDDVTFVNTSLDVEGSAFNLKDDMFESYFGQGFVLNRKLMVHHQGQQTSAVGLDALGRNDLWNVGNSALGFRALGNFNDGEYNTALGTQSLLYTTSGNPLEFGFNNCTGVGYDTRVSGSNQVQLGNSQTVTYFHNTAQVRSDARDKADIVDEPLGVDFLKKVRPRQFRWNHRDSYDVLKRKIVLTGADGEYGVLDGSTKMGVVTVADGTGHLLIDDDVKLGALSALRNGTVADVQITIESELMRLPQDGSKKRKRAHNGVVAQELKAACDEMGVDFAGLQHHAVNGGDDVWSVGYEEFIAVLIKSVQELTARVEALEG